MFVYHRFVTDVLILYWSEYCVKLCCSCIVVVEIIQMWRHCRGQKNRIWCVPILLRGVQQLLTSSCEFCLHQQPQGNYETAVFSKSSAVLVSVWNVKMWLQAEQWHIFGTFTHVGSVFLPLETSEIGSLWSKMQPGLFKAQLFIRSTNYIFLSAATTTTRLPMQP